MTATTQVLCSFALTFGVPIGLAAWDLWHIGPTARRFPPGEDVPPDPAPLPDTGVLPDRVKPLPGCLLPQRSSARIPELV